MATHLSDAANMMTPTYLVIVSKGYDVQMKGDVMVARRGNTSFSADGPVALLGLIAMFEMRGEAWQATDDEIDQFVEFCQGSGA